MSPIYLSGFVSKRHFMSIWRVLFFNWNKNTWRFYNNSGRHFKSKAPTKWMEAEWRETLFSLIDSRLLNWGCDVAALQHQL